MHGFLNHISQVMIEDFTNLDLLTAQNIASEIFYATSQNTFISDICTYGSNLPEKIFPQNLVNLFIHTMLKNYIFEEVFVSALGCFN